MRRRTASGVSKKTGEVGPPPVTHRRAVGRRLGGRRLWGLLRVKIAEKLLVVVVGKRVVATTVRKTATPSNHPPVVVGRKGEWN